MAKKLANDYRLWIESATPGTYNIIAGQQNLSVTRNGATIDTTSKDDYPYGTSAPGTRSLSINCDIIPNLPDANGYGRLETQALSSTPVAVNFEIRKNGANGADPADVVLKGAFYINGFNTDMSMNSAVKVTFKLDAASAPVTDALA